MSSAAPSSPRTATVWSMPPVGAPTTSVSARMAASMRVPGGPPPTSSSSAIPTEHSSAADDDSPAPSGTRLSTNRSTPGTSYPASRSAHTTPAAYPAQPSTDRGPSSPSVPSHPSFCWRLVIRTSSSARGRAAAYVACGSATGSTSPAL